MSIDFTAKKLEKNLEQIEDPFHYEVLEILYEKYMAGEVEVQFINGEPFFNLAGQPDAVQLELPLE